MLFRSCGSSLLYRKYSIYASHSSFVRVLIRIKLQTRERGRVRTRCARHWNPDRLLGRSDPNPTRLGQVMASAYFECFFSRGEAPLTSPRFAGLADDLRCRVHRGTHRRLSHCRSLVLDPRFKRIRKRGGSGGQGEMRVRWGPAIHRCLRPAG